MFSFGVYGAYAQRPGPFSGPWTTGICLRSRPHSPAAASPYRSRTLPTASIGGRPGFRVVYSRVSVTNNGTSTVTVEPGAVGGFASLDSVSNAVPAGQTVDHDYVVAVDDFGSGSALPTRDDAGQQRADVRRRVRADDDVLGRID